jgi:hypothetical protein
MEISDRAVGSSFHFPRKIQKNTGTPGPPPAAVRGKKSAGAGAGAGLRLSSTPEPERLPADRKPGHGYQRFQPLGGHL